MGEPAIAREVGGDGSLRLPRRERANGGSAERIAHMPVRRRPVPIMVAAMMLAVIILVGCSSGSDSAAVSQDVATAPPPTHSPIPGVPTLPSKADLEANDRAAATGIAHSASDLQTMVALTPNPGYTPFALRTQSPEPPTPTWATGWSPASRPFNTFNPEYFSCWNGNLNDKLLRICAGHEQYGGDLEQGVLDIMLLELDQNTIFSDDVYETPGTFGLMHIVVADSNSVTIASEDGQHVFTFDIATRQWVSPTATGAMPLYSTVGPAGLPGTQAPTQVVITRVPSTYPPRTPGSQQAFDTRVTLDEQKRKTAGALAPTRTPKPPMPSRTPRPTATLAFGWLLCGGAANSLEPQYNMRCWQGELNGQYYQVMAGREGRWGDIAQGILTITTLSPDGQWHRIGTFLTPEKQGEVRIASVDGLMVYLVPDDYQPPDAKITPIPGVVFVFDIATRQWVSP